MEQIKVPAHGEVYYAYKVVDSAGGAAKLDISTFQPEASLMNGALGDLVFKADADDMLVGLTWKAAGTTVMKLKGDRRDGDETVLIETDVEVVFEASEADAFVSVGQIDKAAFEAGPNA